MRFSEFCKFLRVKEGQKRFQDYCDGKPIIYNSIYKEEQNSFNINWFGGKDFFTILNQAIRDAKNYEENLRKMQSFFTTKSLSDQDIVNKLTELIKNCKINLCNQSDQHKALEDLESILTNSKEEPATKVKAFYEKLDSPCHSSNKSYLSLIKEDNYRSNTKIFLFGVAIIASIVTGILPAVAISHFSGYSMFDLLKTQGEQFSEKSNNFKARYELIKKDIPNPIDKTIDSFSISLAPK